MQLPQGLAGRAVASCAAARYEQLRAGLLLVVLVLLPACDLDVPTTPETNASASASRALVEDLAAAELAAAGAGRNERGAEDEILRLEAQVPGVGGVFLDPDNNRFVVLLRDRSRDAAATAAIRAIATTLKAESTMGWLDDQSVDVRDADFAFSELVAWKHIFFPHALGLSSFVSIGADERTNRVVVTVEEELDRRQAMILAADVGIPEAALRVEIGRRSRTLNSLTSLHRPSGGGIEIADANGNGPCTHGWTVTTGQGEEGFLVAGHCAGGTVGGGVTGSNVFQTEWLNTNHLVGEVELNEPWDLEISGCTPSQFQCTRADVAFVSSTEASKKLARPVCLGTNDQPPWEAGCTPYPYTAISFWWTEIGDVTAAWVGRSVDKVGRSSGWTRGTISSTCDSMVATSGSVTYVVLCADEVSGASHRPGDSGAPVFASASSQSHVPRPLGILFAGGGTDFDENDACTENCTFVYSTWGNINFHLGRYFDPKTPTPFEAYVSGPNNIQAEASYQWQINASGGSGSYTYAWKRCTLQVSSCQSAGSAKTYSSWVVESTPDFALVGTASSTGEIPVADTLYVFNNIGGGPEEFGHVGDVER